MCNTQPLDRRDCAALTAQLQPYREHPVPHPEPQSSARGDIVGPAVAEPTLRPRCLHGPRLLPSAFALLPLLPATEITCQALANNEP